ncbi:Gfo/Idh/MocA family protein [Planctomyces sp. SH-PL62]|uniref:Gfo/Idh/MocA family protein n=1 Tax=Planctomyces sp. SH-PL62 TaxID=1636152 RepID=UPI00078E1F0F|nr:Gfo/Idh/MocA family oxidoreductase [Planctomyces sp. SH-PL62]AMV38911.1 Inositol 2-dehydrogenase [Planctomyces sp. SH-PL62]
MPPITLNRRRFLGCSAASLALSQGPATQSAPVVESAGPVRIGLIGVGNRGTTLLRTLLELPGVGVPVVCDPEPRHRARGEGIVEKATGRRAESVQDPRRVLERADLDAVVVAVPCDLHEGISSQALSAGKHLYAEKPMAITVAGCDRLISESARAPGVVIHVGFQRRSNPRFQEAVDLFRSGGLGPLIEARASWTSSNGPLTGHDGWLGDRRRSGDFMVEQAVHIWDVLSWIHGGPPDRAVGWGRRGLFAREYPGRDVTDHYGVELAWADGFRASFVQSYVAPADENFTGSHLRVLGLDGGFDFGSGTLTYRDRERPRRTIQPGVRNDTRLALEAFVAAVRAETPPPPPVTLQDARAATLTGLLVRKAVDEGRTATLDEILDGSTSA